MSSRFFSQCARISSVILAVSLPAMALTMPEINPASGVAPLAVCVATFVMLANRKPAIAE